MFLRRIEDGKLAQYAYLIGCQRTGEALVIDPERDVDRYVEMAKGEGLTIVAAAETHIHADFLSGARELAEHHDVELFLSEEGGPDWQSFWAKDSDYDVQFLKDGDTFEVGNIRIQAVHTPGHTPEHMSYLITDLGGGADEPMGMATGDFVFVGDLGRPDLLESAAGIAGMMEPSARTLYASTVEFLDLPDYLQVWPAHGAGSACGKALGAVPETTIGYERRFSPAIAAVKQGEDAFVDFILEGQPEPPVYFARMKALNRDGASLLGGVPKPARIAVEDLLDVAQRSDAVIVDTREEKADYLAGHVAGSIYSPFNKSFHTFAGSYFDPELPVTLIADEAMVDDVVRNLIRIGIDDVRGFFTPDGLDAFAAAGGTMVTTDVIDFEEMERRRRDPSAHVLDVRKGSEFVEGHVPGALNIAHTRLMPRLAEVPEGGALMVHCKAGGRAAAASSFLERNGRRVVVVDGEFEGWTELPEAGSVGAEAPA